MRLLVVRRGHAPYECALTTLPTVLSAGDLLVLNDAATLPASLSTRTADGPLELRLLPHDGRDETHWQALVMGAGDWRQDTNHRGPPPAVRVGQVLGFGPLHAKIVGIHSDGRLVSIRFREHGSAFWTGLYEAGRPVQYSHQAGALPLEAFQTVYGTRPWAAEMPSAGRALTWDILHRLESAGVAVRTLTHGAGLSALGDPQLDAMLPLREAYELPRATVTAIETTHDAGGRVIAVGTTVVRALEGNHARHGRLHPGPGDTDLVLAPTTRLKVVDGILTGMHDPSESHYRLLGAFLDDETLELAWRLARERGFRSHEFGDVELIVRRRAQDLAA